MIIFFLQIRGITVFLRNQGITVLGQLVFFVCEHWKVYEPQLVAVAACDGVAKVRHHRHGLRHVEVAQLDQTNWIWKTDVPHNLEMILRIYMH